MTSEAALAKGAHGVANTHSDFTSPRSGDAESTVLTMETDLSRSRSIMLVPRNIVSYSHMDSHHICMNIRRPVVYLDPEGHVNSVNAQTFVVRTLSNAIQSLVVLGKIKQHNTRRSTTLVELAKSVAEQPDQFAYK